MVQLVNRKFVDLMVLPELNYRTVQPKGVEAKTDILYRSTLNDNTKTRGWRSEYAAEVVSLDNAVLYQIPRLVALGISSKEQLVAYYRSVLESRLQVANESKTEYRNQLIGVIKAQINEVDAGNVHDAVLGGIHRGMGFDKALAMWEYENAQPLAEGQEKLSFSDEIPCEVYNPLTYGDLIDSAHRRNGEALQQVKLTALDYIILAIYVITVRAGNQVYFRLFASTGARNMTPAEMKKAKEEGKIQDVGGKMSLYYNIALVALKFPSLDIVRRAGIDPVTANEADKKARIDINRITSESLKSGDILRNINYFRVCANAKLAEGFYNSSRANDPEAGSEAFDIKLEKAKFWDQTPEGLVKIEQWWNNHCPGQFPDGKMPSQEKAKTTVSVEKVEHIAEHAKQSLLKTFAGSLLSVGGADPTVGTFMEGNQASLNVADLFFRLASDPLTASKLMSFGSSLEAVRDKDAASFRQTLDDAESLVTSAITALGQPPLKEEEVKAEQPEVEKTPVAKKHKAK